MPKSPSNGGKLAGKLSNVRILKGRKKTAGRYCVAGTADKKAPGFKGRGSTRRFAGCFVSKADAEKRADAVSKYEYERTGKTSVRRSRKSRR